MTAARDRDRPPRTIAVLTTGRQDWGILHSTCSAIAARPDLRLRLVVGGMHLSVRHGLTVDQVRADGFEPAVELDWLGVAADPPADLQASAALAAIGSWLRAERPDALLLVGDRLETAAAALAATVDLVPIIHLHGGELSLGAFDDPLRHAISKLSHLHLASTEEHARRIVALGEDPATVHVVGAPGLDAAYRTDLPDRADLERDFGHPLASPLVLVTVHPETLADRPTGAAEAVAAAMDALPGSYVITAPNADPGGDAIRRILAAPGGDAAGVEPAGGRRIVVDALGERRYWGLLRIADAMLGNSSSGLIEAPAVDLPAVNVGDRQLGRQREANVIDVPAEASAVVAGLRTALDPAFRAGLAGHRPALVDGHAGQRIAAIIAAWRPPSPPRKRPLAVEPWTRSP